MVEAHKAYEEKKKIYADPPKDVRQAFGMSEDEVLHALLHEAALEIVAGIGRIGAGNDDDLSVGVGVGKKDGESGGEMRRSRCVMRVFGSIRG